MNIEMLQMSEVLGTRHRELRELLTISEHIQELADSSDWVEAVAQQSRRRALMDVFFAEECAPSESELVGEVISAILAIDQKVADVLYEQRSAMLTDANQSRQNVRNVGSYLSNSMS
tara:strand:- start:291 stop:641 length:351 start_codon:yes stop_codon:yes gene_type:complete